MGFWLGFCGVGEFGNFEWMVLLRKVVVSAVQTSSRIRSHGEGFNCGISLREGYFPL